VGVRSRVTPTPMTSPGLLVARSVWGVAHGWNTDQFDRSVVIGPKYSQLAGGNGDGDG
jgi:hypothetical protein